MDGCFFSAQGLQTAGMLMVRGVFWDWVVIEVEV